ncbi:helix-turn-helix domain-containing protein [Cellulosimicrobium sp. CUA-896]|uniref:winged helix-turn-helix transcriptional regulator n=1 Tax=Cellulosimicrobium sp. CUA-896 TaxID=1517881 RepID=UPI00095FB84E|nr:helix-turn-helix domain-containing protein [Cellulosimicrobium sp. CUA-896]OLT53222.1 HxlR family transcriptional regulator [Cellulosimicrobium sp. CUA-896]
MTTDTRALDAGPTDEMVADVFQRGCTSRHVLESVTGRWGVLTVAGLRDGGVRFNALRRRIDGVSEKMLAQTLQGLERDGIVVRDVRGTIPPHVEYSLTPLGRRVADSLTALIDVLEDAVDEVGASQRAYDARRGS